MSPFLPRVALMLGNVAIGLSILAPAGMLAELAGGLAVDIRQAGLLVTYGAVVVCVSSPIGAWLTTRLDRRVLLVGLIGTLAVGEVATAFAPNYTTVLVLRLLMLAAAAVYTPQAAATVALIVPIKQRPSAIAFVFLGWSLAIAGGLPLVTLLSAQFGWRAAYGVLAAIALLIVFLLGLALPAGLVGHPLSLRSFGFVARNRTILLMLAITLLTTSGQFILVVYLGPLLDKLAGQGPTIAGLFFALLGTMGVTGNIVATGLVPKLGTYRMLALSLGSMLIGMTLWAAGAGALPVMGAGIFFLGLGFASSNSMQQARLAAAAPNLASASIALNTSVLYLGQSIGSGLGGLLFMNGQYRALGYVAAVLGAAALVVLFAAPKNPAPAT